MGKRGFGHEYLRGKTWWIKFYRDGGPFYDCAKTESRDKARDLLKQRLAEKDTARLAHTTVGDFLDDLLEFYRVHNPRSVRDFAQPAVESALRPYFGKYRIPQITTARLQSYQAKRKRDGRANATVNREMALMRRAFNLGKRATPAKVSVVPHFPMLPENHVRKGFLEKDAYLKLLGELRSELKGLLVVGYHVGCRAGELLRLRWDQVDLAAGRISLYAGETKNDEGRQLPIYGDMLATLRALRDDRDASFPRCKWVFHRNGRQIKRFSVSWDKACERAGVPELLFHDLRRSAVRNMVRAGVPERVAMAISGHKTRAIFDRYNIVDDKDLTEAGDRLTRFLGEGTVTPAVTKVK